MSQSVTLTIGGTSPNFTISGNSTSTTFTSPSIQLQLTGSSSSSFTYTITDGEGNTFTTPSIPSGSYNTIITCPSWMLTQFAIAYQYRTIANPPVVSAAAAFVWNITASTGTPTLTSATILCPTNYYSKFALSFVGGLAEYGYADVNGLRDPTSPVIFQSTIGISLMMDLGSNPSNLAILNTYVSTTGSSYNWTLDSTHDLYTYTVQSTQAQASPHLVTSSNVYMPTMVDGPAPINNTSSTGQYILGINGTYITTDRYLRLSIIPANSGDTIEIGYVLALDGSNNYFIMGV